MRQISKDLQEKTLQPLLKNDVRSVNETYAFLNDLQVILENKKVEAKMPAYIPYSKLQCAYVLDFKHLELVSMHGVEEMLGYEKEEITFESLVNIVHPEDVDNVMAILYTVLEYVASNPLFSELLLSVAYRLRKKNGNYIKVLRQTSIGYNPYDKETIYHSNVLTDISFMKSSNQVEWTFNAPNFDREKFKMYVPQSNQQLFSSRELEVLELIDKGLTSHAIAKALFISKHTVDTHRRKMLQKTGCPNAIALLEFYRSTV